MSEKHITDRQIDNLSVAATQRNFKIDNFKAVLIFLVVLGHFYDKISFQTSSFQYLVIYFFHMPAFAFLSGVCFKKSVENKIFKNILYPYILFQFIYLLIPLLRGTAMADLAVQFTNPVHALWYMLAFFMWSLLANALSLDDKKSAIKVVAICFAVAILVGFWDAIGAFLTLSRMFVYFPFFVFGVFIKNYYFEIFFKKYTFRTQLICCEIVLALTLLLAVYRGKIVQSGLYNATSYANVGSTPVLRVINFGVAFIFIVFFVAVLPNKTLPIVTYIGRNTLSVLILHIFVVQFLPLAKILSYLPLPIVTVPIAAFACVGVLSMKPVVKVFSAFVRWPF